MGRPRLKRKISLNPRANYFKPQGIPMRDLAVVEITHEELESLRLSNYEELGQIECAERMKTSQSTLQRIIKQARKKVTDALIHGKAIKITKE